MFNQLIDFQKNLLLMSDSYKYSHNSQYPSEAARIFSFFESRGGRYDEIAFFGLQYFIKRYLSGVVVTEEKIAQAKLFIKYHMPTMDFYEEGWRYILEECDGKLPVEIRAIPEGTIVPVKNAMVTVVNTGEDGEKTRWVTNFIETLLSQVWYTCSVATQSREMKKDILDALIKTGDPETISIKLHDFGFRGVTCPEQAALGGAAHLTSFSGSDTVIALPFVMQYYLTYEQTDGKTLEEVIRDFMPGFSLPASEHSTMTSWKRKNEFKAYENMLKVYPTGPVSVVSDSYDIFNACQNGWGGELKEQVLGRDGVLVVRPDSGDPVTVLRKILKILGDSFGTTVNEKGYRLLHEKVRVIQGDGIDYLSLRSILNALIEDGWSADNIVFGSGGGLLQKLNRDTQKFAIKCSAAKVDGKWVDVIKDPITDKGKKSKAGRLALVCENGEHKTQGFGSEGESNLLVPVFRDGELLKEYSFDEIRELAKVA